MVAKKIKSKKVSTKKPRTPNPDSEYNIQCKFTKYLENLNLRNRELKLPKIAYCAATIDEVRGSRRGGICVKKGYVRGEPDYSINEGRGGYFGLKIEFKSKHGAVQDHQEAKIKELNKRGYKTIICRSTEEAIKNFLAYIKMKPTEIKREPFNVASILDEELIQHLKLTKKIVNTKYSLTKEDVIELD